VTLVQTGAIFSGTNEQIGSCTFQTGETNDNSGTFQIANGLIGELSEQGWAISFSEPGVVSCNYQGTLLPPVMSGTVSCAGFVEGLGQVNATGTWCAESVGGSLGPARAAAEHYNETRRIPTCT
jgi:hypothetical protein